MFSVDHLSPKILLLGLWVQNYSYVLFRHLLPFFYCVDICSDGAKAVMGETAGMSAWIKTVVPNCTSSHCIIHHHACGVFLKSAFSLKNVRDEAIKMMNVVKPRNMCWNVKYFRDVQWLSWGKALMGLSELQATGLLLPATPWWNTFLYTWKNKEYLADIFSNMNAKACYLRGKQLMGLVCQW